MKIVEQNQEKIKILDELDRNQTKVVGDNQKLIEEKRKFGYPENASLYGAKLRAVLEEGL